VNVLYLFKGNRVRLVILLPSSFHEHAVGLEDLSNMVYPFWNTTWSNSLRNCC